MWGCHVSSLCWSLFEDAALQRSLSAEVAIPPSPKLTFAAAAPSVLFGPLAWCPLKCDHKPLLYPHQLPCAHPLALCQAEIGELEDCGLWPVVSHTLQPLSLPPVLRRRAAWQLPPASQIHDGATSVQISSPRISQQTQGWQ